MKIQITSTFISVDKDNDTHEACPKMHTVYTVALHTTHHAVSCRNRFNAFIEIILYSCMGHLR